VNAAAYREDQHGRRPIDRISSAQLLRSRLQKVRLGGQRRSVGSLEDGENASHRGIDVDVAGAVERIEGQQISAAVVFGGYLVRLLAILGNHAGEVAAVFAGAEKNVVRHDIQFHLLLALNVDRLRRSVRAGEGT